VDTIVPRIQATSELPKLLADLREEDTLAMVRHLLEQGEDPLWVLEECQLGMVQVGERYHRRDYYISGLIMAGEIMSQVGKFLAPYMQARYSGHARGYILMGTVAGDIHFIGKNILKLLLRCYGFTVSDLGEDVPAAKFVENAAQEQPQVLCLSCLLSSAIDSMREVVDQLHFNTHHLHQQPHILIGGLVDQKVCEYVGADYWARDAMEGVRICQRLAG
jgi:methanogenic corrinoid protein MtbC1